MLVSKGNLELIEDYLSGSLSQEEKLNVGAKIKENSTFAKDFGFYLQAKQAAKQLANENRKAEWEAIRQAKKKQSGRIVSFRVIIGSVAACLFLVFSWLPSFNNAEPEGLAMAYIDQNLGVLSVSMDTNKDSLELGTSLYNQKKYSDAVRIFEATRFQKAQEELQALTYTGLAYLQLKQYDKALGIFKKLELNKELVSNKGKFYQALTLMRRNLKDDKAKAISLLNEVVKQNLGGKKEATEWLKKMK